MSTIRDTKTNHQDGYHKPVKNPTTNYPMDKHSIFCRRCRSQNRVCPITGGKPSKSCEL